MSSSVDFVFYIFQKFYDLLFNARIDDSGATVGWVIIAIMLFVLIVNSLFNIPQGLSHSSVKGEKGKRWHV